MDAGLAETVERAGVATDPAPCRYPARTPLRSAPSPLRVQNGDHPAVDRGGPEGELSVGASLARVDSEIGVPVFQAHPALPDLGLEFAHHLTKVDRRRA